MRNGYKILMQPHKRYLGLTDCVIARTIKKVAWIDTTIQKKDTIVSRKNQHPINLSLGDISNRIRYTVEALRGLGILIVKRLMRMLYKYI